MPARAGGRRGEYRADETVKVLAVNLAARVGAWVGRYDNERLSNVVANEGITDLGPVTATYDPEWEAWLAGEL